MSASNKIAPAGGYNNISTEYITPQTSSKIIEVSNDETYPSAGSLYARFDGVNSQFDCNALGTYSGANITVAGNILPEANATRSLGSAAAVYLESYARFAAGDVQTTVAAAGSTIGDATQVTNTYNQITSGSAGQGVKLSTSAPIGSFQVIRNNLASTAIKLYPPDGSSSIQVWGTTVGAGGNITLLAGLTALCRKVTATAWHIVLENDRNVIVDGGTTSGSSNAYTATSLSYFGTLYTGLQVAIVVNHTNTGAATLNLDSTGAIAIRTKRDSSVALGAGAMMINSVQILTYDGTVWRLQSDDEGLKTWTPAYTGQGTLTFSTVTTDKATYRRVGNLVFFWVRATGTTAGTGNAIYVSAPVNISTNSNSTFTMGLISDGSPVPGYMGFESSSNVFSFVRIDSANYTAGAGRVVGSSGVYEAA